MTDRQAAAGFCLLLVCFTTYLCFKGIAWVIANGWRSMLGLVAVRGEAVIEWQDVDRQERTDWNHADVEAIARLTQAATAPVDHFDAWESEIADEKGIARSLRRMERWSR